MTTQQDAKYDQVDATPGGTVVDNAERTPIGNTDHKFNYTREPTGLTVVHRDDDEDDDGTNNNNIDDRLERTRSDVSETKCEDDARTPEEISNADEIRRRLATVELDDGDGEEDADEDDLQDKSKVEYNPSGDPKGKLFVLPMSFAENPFIIVNSW